MTNEAWECLLDSETTADGARIEGHPYIAVLKIIDTETNKEYEVLHCERCGNYSVAFNGSIHHDNDSAFYQVIEVGDKA